MLKKIFFSIIGSLGIFAIYSFASALNPFDITYPIAELGNCASQGECKQFCDNSENAVACTDWAEKNGFVSKSEAKKVRNVRQRQEDQRKSEDPNYDGTGAMLNDYGPGGCKSPQECDNFCRKEENLGECMKYSIEKGFMSQEEADKILEKSKKEGPGGCKSREECDKFCRVPDNMPACMQFAVDDGKISQEEAGFIIEQNKARGGPGQGRGPGGPRGPGGQGPKSPAEPKIDEKKAEEILAGKDGPGGCKTMEECGNFCANPDNMETCMNFAIENNLMPPQEIEKAKKMMSIGGPGGCKGQQECDVFCSKEENRDICMNFTIDNGLMAPEEIERMKKEMEIVKKLDRQAGPGGCKDPRECNDFCSQPDNIEECMNFGAKTGMMPKQDIQQARNQMRMSQERVGQIEERQGRFIQQGAPGMMPPPPGRGEPFQQDGPEDGPDGRQGMPFRGEGFMPPVGQGTGSPMMPPGMPFRDDEFQPPLRRGEPQGEPFREGEFREIRNEGQMFQAPMMPQGNFVPPRPFQQNEEQDQRPPVPYSAPGQFMMPYGGPQGQFGQPTQQQFAPPPSPTESNPPLPPPAPAPIPPAPTAPTSWRSQSILGAVLTPFLEIFR